ncbi:MAG: DUF262 domain-containing protein [Candidatus Aenigmatarchaeota archaeon]
MEERPAVDVQDWDFSELKVEFKRKTLAIPQFQRKFVWNQKKICDLVDSIYKTYPIGSFLIWDSDNKDIFKLDTSILPPPNRENNFIKYILDGQQRIASLYGIIFGETIENESGTKINCKNICFDLESATNNPDPDEVVFVYRKDGPDNTRYFSLYDLLDENKLDGFCDKIKDERKKIVLRRCHHAFSSYKFPVVIIKNQNEDHLAESFVRVNDRGVKLDTVNLVIATAWRKDFDLQKNIDEFKADLPYGFADLENENILQAISLNLKDGFSKAVQLNLAKEWKEWRLEKVKEEWKKNKESIQKAIDYLHDNLGVRELGFIPFGIMVSILSCFFYNNRRNPDKNQAKLIKKWFWQAALLGRYSGAGFSTNVLEDKRKLEKIAKGQKVSFNYGRSIKLEDIKKTTLYRVDYLSNAFLCLLALQQPRRFDNGNAVNLEEVVSSINDKQRHHIFPRNILKGHFKEDEINTICNICFIPADLNEHIKDRKPSEYFRKYEKKLGVRKFEMIMKTHLIPYDKSSGIWIDDVVKGYKKFVEQRANLLKKEFEKLLAG